MLATSTQSLQITELAITIKDWLTILGIPAIIVALLFIGRKLQILDDLKKTVEKIKHNIKAMADSMINSDLVFDHTKLQSYSPFKLTEKGKEYLEKIGFISTFNSNKEIFFDCIDMDHPKTKYDVELAAYRSMLLLRNKEDLMKPIKIHLYNNPNDEESFESISRYAGVYIRDQYLDLHPEIVE